MRTVTKHDNPPPLGQRVEIIRIRKGISRTALAATLRMHRTAPAKWAAGEAAPRDLDAVARALGSTVAEIYAARPERRTRKTRAAA